MQNLACKINLEQRVSDALQCVACGEELTGPDAASCAWHTWRAFFENMGLRRDELLCGACGEYLRGFFDER